MEEKQYLSNIIEIVEGIEVNSRVRKIQDNSEKIRGYWEIGKILVEAQGGETRAKYGDNLIKKWSVVLMNKYNKVYSRSNMNYMRQLYLLFPNVQSLVGHLTWTHFLCLLPVKNENERNYYINQVILNNLSVRELRQEIKNKAFDRLSYADKSNIKLITSNEYSFNIKDMIKDPILINVNKKASNLNEKVLHKYIINMLENRFLELGIGFALVGHEYVINAHGHRFKLDLLFFNYKLNAFVVVEVKIDNMKIKDVDQLYFYVDLVDSYVKEDANNKTIGLLIAKEKDKFVVKHATNKDIFVASYKLNS